MTRSTTLFSRIVDNVITEAIRCAIAVLKVVAGIGLIRAIVDPYIFISRSTNTASSFPSINRILGIVPEDRLSNEAEVRARGVASYVLEKMKALAKLHEK
jgi:hypothetical protein